MIKCNSSHVYSCILRNSIKKELVLDDLHLGNVLIALRNAGYCVDRNGVSIPRYRSLSRSPMGLSSLLT